MKISALTLLIIPTLLLPGCETLPTQDQMASADYGGVPDREKAKSVARQLILKTLIDPYSAVITCKNPSKGVLNKAFKNRYGYLLECQVNAKNRFGAFTGTKSVYFWIRNGSIEDLEAPFEFHPSKS